VISRRPGGGGSRPGAHELTSLDERLGLLLLVRFGMVAVVVVAAAFATGEVGFDAAQVAPLSGAYLIIAAGAEWYRRSQWRGRTVLHRAILPLDAVYLAIVTTPGGGPRSPLLVLFSVQLIAVTLLVNERVGIGMALVDSILFVLIPTLSLSTSFGSLVGVHVVAEPTGTETALAILGFWIVAICTAFFSSVSERELRRSKAELEALAEMAARLEGVLGEAEILALLLRTLIDAFPFRRGALWWTQATQPEGLSLADRDARVLGVAVEAHHQPDRIATEAWAGREALLVRQLDATRDPTAANLLPEARNVVVLPLQIDHRDSGIILLEHQGHSLTARLPRRTVVMLTQFTAHAALSLRNARLLAQRERQAAIDGLTGLANRREFDQVLTREVHRSRRTKEPVSLVVFDVDHFKEINDSLGHLAGDEVLRVIGQVLAGAVRDMDLVARYGGEEFALVLPRCDQADAVLVVVRVTDAIRRHAALNGVTVSAGVATLPANASEGVTLIAAADEALYESKRAGRDRFSVSNRYHDSQPASNRGAH
jgi:diguanylate cyclase (GGDEF)-like protein